MEDGELNGQKVPSLPPASRNWSDPVKRTPKRSSFSRQRLKEKPGAKGDRRDAPEGRKLESSVQMQDGGHAVGFWSLTWFGIFIFCITLPLWWTLVDGPWYSGDLQHDVSPLGLELTRDLVQARQLVRQARRQVRLHTPYSSNFPVLESLERRLSLDIDSANELASQIDRTLPHEIDRARDNSQCCRLCSGLVRAQEQIYGIASSRNITAEVLTQAISDLTSAQQALEAAERADWQNSVIHLALPWDHLPPAQREQADREIQRRADHLSDVQKSRDILQAIKIDAKTERYLELAAHLKAAVTDLGSTCNNAQADTESKTFCFCDVELVERVTRMIKTATASFISEHVEADA